jgi:hypothetical protein
MHSMLGPDASPDDGPGTTPEWGVGVEGWTRMCDGCLVLHRDGAVAYCTEELDGRGCSGYDQPHLAGVMPCRVQPYRVRCRRCQHALQFRLIIAPDYEPELDLVSPN